MARDINFRARVIFQNCEAHSDRNLEPIICHPHYEQEEPFVNKMDKSEMNKVFNSYFKRCGKILKTVALQVKV